MTFDHRDKTKKCFNVSDGSDKTMRRLLDEIDKCDVVCRPCHDKREWNRHLEEFDRGFQNLPQIKAMVRELVGELEYVC